jgi:hypothetical protein
VPPRHESRARLHRAVHLLAELSCIMLHTTCRPGPADNILGGSFGDPPGSMGCYPGVCMSAYVLGLPICTDDNCGSKLCERGWMHGPPLGLIPHPKVPTAISPLHDQHEAPLRQKGGIFPTMQGRLPGAGGGVMCRWRRLPWASKLTPTGQALDQGVGQLAAYSTPARPSRR